MSIVVVIDDSINKLVDSDHRATVLSVESLFLMLFVWGLSMEFISIVETLQYIGLFVLVIGGFICYFILLPLILLYKGVFPRKHRLID